MNIDVAAFVPSLATSAEAEARRSGRRKRRLVAARLIFVTLGALFGALTFIGYYSSQRLDYAGVAGVLAFIVVLGIRLMTFSDQSIENAEARGNAVAILAASHAWRYAVGARPYEITVNDATISPRDLLLVNLRAYQKIMLEYSWTTTGSTQITDQMTRLRAMGLDERKSIYLQHRIRPLSTEQGKISRSLTSKARVFMTLVLLVELVGIPAGALKAITISSVGILGVTGAAAASLALWADTVDFRRRGRTAATTCLALASASDMLESAQTEREWAALVARMEEQLTLESEAVLASDTIRYLLGPEIDDVRTMSPAEYFAAVEELKRQIWDESDRLPKLEPDVIVALNPGGAIVGGILYFVTRASRFFPLSFRSGLDRKDIENIVNAVPWQSRKADRLSILIVDASVKSGNNLREAVDLIRRSVEAKGWLPEEGQTESGDAAGRRYILRTAAITRKPLSPEVDTRPKLDYLIDEVTERFPYGSI